MCPLPQQLRFSVWYYLNSDTHPAQFRTNRALLHSDVVAPLVTLFWLAVISGGNEPISQLSFFLSQLNGIFWSWQERIMVLDSVNNQSVFWHIIAFHLSSHRWTLPPSGRKNIFWYWRYQGSFSLLFLSCIFILLFYSMLLVHLYYD